MDPGVFAGVTEKGIVCCGIREFLLKEVIGDAPLPEIRPVSLALR